MPLDKQVSILADDLINFMRNKFGFEHDPKIKFIKDKKNSSNILAMTGHYDPDGEEICVYVSDRHPKDILRSLAHELMHHVQKYEGEMEHHDLSATKDPNYIMHDKYLKMIEADAFERGNIAFREWEASKKGDNQMLNEGKDREIEVNENLKNSHNYSTETRALPEVSNLRDETIFNDLLKKFGIKK